MAFHFRVTSHFVFELGVTSLPWLLTFWPQHWSATASYIWQ